jgi:N-acetylmuramic acid 6-phosphate etherase
MTGSSGSTESPSLLHTNLDQYESTDLALALIDDQAAAAAAVREAHVQIAAAIDAAAKRIAACDEARLIYIGAGTSGRLGLLDSVELFPTFSWPKERAVALLAGGMDALFVAVEGAEDDRDAGIRDVAAAHVAADDVVLLLAASGSTPYVLGAAFEANRRGALTIGIANNQGAKLTEIAEVGITLATGPEVVSGSTRLKAGTAQKMTLNTISSGIMVRLNKVYGNLMVDVKPTNAKLYKRAINLVVAATHLDEREAKRTLEACNYRVKTAIVSLLTKRSIEESDALLVATNGSVRAALEGGDKS